MCLYTEADSWNKAGKICVVLITGFYASFSLERSLLMKPLSEAPPGSYHG